MLLASVFTGAHTATAHERLTPENQLISLRHIMEQAQTENEKEAAMTLIGQTGTLQAMYYAGTYLQDKQVAEEAAEAIVAIALKHPEYNGEWTRQLVQKSLKHLDKKARKSAKQWLKDADPNEKGYVNLFNGKDLSGWKGLVDNPISRAKMSADQLKQKQEKADDIMRANWKVEDGLLVYEGHSFDNLCSEKAYGDFEMTVDWKLDPNGEEPDAGVYLRGTPQVQIWDIRRTNVGAQVGSGGLYNNQQHRSTPTSVEDNKLGEWNTFYIRMVGDKVTVKLNGVTVVDNVVLENYWDRKQPIFPREQIEMQAHGSKVFFRDIYLKELWHAPTPRTGNHSALRRTPTRPGHATACAWPLLLQKKGRTARPAFRGGRAEMPTAPCGLVAGTPGRWRDWRASPLAMPPHARLSSLPENAARCVGMCSALHRASQRTASAHAAHCIFQHTSVHLQKEWHRNDYRAASA